ncbi:unnamed protein product [Angiostrongylus costaricensis]|uniref:MFS domain-containing protein n=1 Tax=Angiostrongylus costaricensis TaxID=334426 RepID=A0A0R3PL50_ANGCS|nr:unnamed protein product [Angiostrongylus costaricensis]
MTSCLNGVMYALIAFLGTTLGNDSLFGKNLLHYLASAIPACVIGVVVVAVLPETPKFLFSRGEYEKAVDSIKLYYGESAIISESLKSIEKDVREASTEKAKFSDLFAQKHLWAALLLFLASLQNTVALWTILFSSTFYLESIGVAHSLAQWSSSLMAGAFLAGTVSGAVLIERCGRRSIIIWSNLTNMASLSLYVFFAEMSTFFEPMKYGCPPMLTIFGFTYGVGVGPVARFIGSELVTLRYRSMLTSVGFAWDTIMSCITAFSCGPLFNLIGPKAFLVLYVVPSISCTFYLTLFLPETRGRETGEIVTMLKKH